MDKQITLSLDEYNAMLEKIEELNNKIHKLSTVKSVKVIEVFSYSLYKAITNHHSNDDFSVTSYYVDEDYVDRKLSKIHINNIREQNKATKLIKELCRFKNQEINIQGLSFWDRIDFLFNKRIDLNGVDNG